MSLSAQLATWGTEEQQSAELSLTQAFARFTEAAGSLERSYHHLEQEVVRLRCELEERNAELARSLEENRSIRLSLFRILDGLPCGVLVVNGKSGRLSAVNPGEVVGFRGPVVLSMPLDRSDGLRYGDRIVTWGARPTVRVGDALLGRVIDGKGDPQGAAAARNARKHSQSPVSRIARPATPPRPARTR